MKRVVKIVGGSLTVLAGIALLVLPGPGIVVIAAGLGVLGTEIPWLQRRMESAYARLPEKVRRRVPKVIVDRLR